MQMTIDWPPELLIEASSDHHQHHLDRVDVLLFPPTANPFEILEAEPPKQIFAPSRIEFW